VILLKLHVTIIFCVLRERATLQSWSKWIESELCAEKRFVDVEPRTVLIIALKKKTTECVQESVYMNVLSDEECDSVTVCIHECAKSKDSIRDFTSCDRILCRWSCV
jgi:CRISPR/Cas system-associated endoribonuclease Cas2